MAPEEFQFLLDDLGLTLKWVAKEANVSLFVVENWQKGQEAMDDEFANYLLSIKTSLESTIEKIVNEHKVAAKYQGKSKPVYLVKYKTDEDLQRYREDFADFPASCYEAVMKKVRRALLSLGIPTHLLTLDPVAFEVFRKENHLPNTVFAQMKWAEFGFGGRKE